MSEPNTYTTQQLRTYHSTISVDSNRVTFPYTVNFILLSLSLLFPAYHLNSTLFFLNLNSSNIFFFFFFTSTTYITSFFLSSQKQVLSLLNYFKIFICFHNSSSSETSSNGTWSC